MVIRHPSMNLSLCSCRDAVVCHRKKERKHGEQFVTVGEGWLKRDNIYEEFFQNHVMQHAVYTHAYDPTGTKLFVGGGPRYSGLTGSYAAVW